MTPKKTPSKSFRLTRRRLLQGGLLGLGGLTLGDSLVYEPHAVQVETLSLETAKLPPGEVRRVVQITDLHLAQVGGYYRRVVELVRGLQPDLLVYTGDYLEERRNLREVQSFLGLLRGLAPSYAVQGNWEYWARLEGENLRTKFAARDVDLLINEVADVDLAGVPLRILGLDYPSGSDPLARLSRQARPDRFNLLLSHVPGFDHRLLGPDIDLVLSGHTHGGQVRIPLLAPLYLPRYAGRFVAGRYNVGPAATPLYVSRGLGTSILPIRLLCRPELTVVEIQGGSERERV